MRGTVIGLLKIRRIKEEYMETILNSNPAARAVADPAAISAANPSYQAFQILRLGFTVAPIVAGLDKFLGLLVNWDQYLAPLFANLTPLGTNLMVVVGVVEIV